MFEEVVKKFGTPLYLYDANELKNRIEYIKSKLEGYKIIYAIKANTFIIPMLDDLVDGYEICSYGEALICNKLFINRDKYVISGVNKEEYYIEELLLDGVKKFTIESLKHYEMLNDLTKKHDKKINVLVRLTSGNQFGVTEEDAKEIFRLNKDNSYITIKGFEYFSGTQKHSIKKINKEVDYLIDVTDRFEKEFNIHLEEVEFGPGAPVYYFQGEEFNEDEYFDELKLALDKIKGHTVSLELGRSIAASCGSYLTSVCDLKTNEYGNTVILDGGMNHLVYYGQTMAMRIPHFEVLPKRDEEEKIYNLYGSLCTINDIIVKNISVRNLKLNDTFVFKKVGAYSSTEGISLFLSRDLPKIVICDRLGNYRLVRDTKATSDLNFPDYK